MMMYIYYLLADVAKMDYCQIKLSEESEKAFIYAVKNQYWYKMYMDDLPIWGKIKVLIFFNS